MKPNTVTRKKQFVPNTFKFLVAVSSLAGTVGIWSTLANRDLTQAYAQNNLNAVPASITANTASVAPTTVPTSAASSVVTQGTPLREVTIPSSNSGSSVTTSNSSSSVNKQPVIIPAPVTSTRSSR